MNATHVSRNVQEKCVKASVMRQRKLYRKYFTLKQHATWERAEAEAKRWAKSFIKTLPSEIPREGRMTKRNRSGVVGVYRSKGIIKKPSGKVYSCPRWIARWPKCPLSGGLSWSVLQFDEDGAFALAVIGLRKKLVDREEVLAHLEPIIETEQLDEIYALKQM
jgi:hypothetical protein